MFSTLPKTNFSYSVIFNLSSANAVNLDQSKNLLFAKELVHQMTIFLDLSKLKAFQTTGEMSLKIKICFWKGKKRRRKREKAGLLVFCPFKPAPCNIFEMLFL